MNKKVMFIILHLRSGVVERKVDWNKKQGIRLNVSYAIEGLKGEIPHEGFLYLYILIQEKRQKLFKSSFQSLIVIPKALLIFSLLITDHFGLLAGRLKSAWKAG